jgi:hypothetical protein
MNPNRTQNNVIWFSLLLQDWSKPNYTGQGVPDDLAGTLLR